MEGKATEHQIWYIQVRKSQELLWDRPPSLALMGNAESHPLISQQLLPKYLHLGYGDLPAKFGLA